MTRRRTVGGASASPGGGGVRGSYAEVAGAVSVTTHLQRVTTCGPRSGLRYAPRLLHRRAERRNRAHRTGGGTP